MGEEAKGPSKGELKKMAKKAEKAAKKDAAKQSGGAPAPAAASGGASSPAFAAVTTPPPLPPKLLLYNAMENDPATLKVVYAALHYGVDLRIAKTKDLPAGCKPGGKPALILGQDYVLGGGGNAMCKALALMSGEAYSFVADEWCETERTSRHSKGGLDLIKLASALEESDTGVHLVGSGDSMADICVVVYLDQHADKIDTWPAGVQTYFKAHMITLERAKAAVQNYIEPSIIEVLTQIFLQAFYSVVPEAEVPLTLIGRCKNPKDGDYQCSGSMPAFASLRKSDSLPENIKAPPQLAEAVVAAIGADHPVITDVKVQKGGFITCRMTEKYLQSRVQTQLSAGSLPKPNVPSEQCVVDFSSPNIAKEMHVGHLRSTIIGEAVCRVLEFVGHSVERVNHVGDWGTQFGMLIQYLKEEYPDFANTMPNITDLTAFYKAAKQRFDEDPDFKKTSQLNVVALQSGDKESMTIWKLLCDVSRGEFQKVYDRLDVKVYECGESFYNDKIPAVVEEFDKAGILRVEEGGAKCVFVEGYTYPLMLQKSDGGYGYDSTDMAALKYRLFTLKANRIIVITDYSQSDHFVLCNTAAKDIGWVNKGQRLQHIGFGTVNGEDGTRFKTRSGETVRLVDLLDEAVRRMEESLVSRMKEGKVKIKEEEIHGVAEAIGYGACKYFDLSRKPRSDYKFSYDDMLDTKGNTAVYLLYARARFESIMAKAKEQFGVDVEELVKNGEPLVITHPSERNLALQVATFSDTIEETLDDLSPYHICDYVYAVSIAAADFSTKCRVLDSPEMKSRLLLCYAATMAMRQCFDLLGIRHVKRI
jgi:arginyl-tRNA synthetase